jgi:hypothetical protein
MNDEIFQQFLVVLNHGSKIVSYGRADELSKQTLDNSKAELVELIITEGGLQGTMYEDKLKNFFLINATDHFRWMAFSEDQIIGSLHSLLNPGKIEA